MYNYSLEKCIEAKRFNCFERHPVSQTNRVAVNVSLVQVFDCVRTYSHLDEQMYVYMSTR